jgi:hypothetical protein
MAAAKIAPILICTTRRIREIRKQAYQERCDELLGCAEAVSIALSGGQLRLPITATFPNPPDVVLSCELGKVALEVSRLTWQRQSQILAEAGNWPGSVVEISPEICVDRKACARKHAPKGQRSGHYEAIRLKGEAHQSPGWPGDSQLRTSLDALAAAVARKKDRLGWYSAAAASVWLFLIDDGIPGACSELLGCADRRYEATCTETGFERIFLFQFSGGNSVRLDPLWSPPNLPEPCD